LGESDPRERPRRRGIIAKGWGEGDLASAKCEPLMQPRIYRNGRVLEREKDSEGGKRKKEGSEIPNEKKTEEVEKYRRGKRL